MHLLQLVPKEVFEDFLMRSLNIAELTTSNSYHCKTNNCIGWCISEEAKTFNCPICIKLNCLECKVKIIYIYIFFHYIILFFPYNIIHLYKKKHREVQLPSDKNQENENFLF